MQVAALPTSCVLLVTTVPRIAAVHTTPHATLGIVLIFPDHGSRYMSKIYSDDWMKEQGFYDPNMPQNKPSIHI